jgi:hypothetical protein
MSQPFGDVSAETFFVRAALCSSQFTACASSNASPVQRVTAVCGVIKIG